MVAKVIILYEISKLFALFFTIIKKAYEWLNKAEKKGHKNARRLLARMYENGEFVFTVHGYGHGVGMSQIGANAMAKEGFSAEEILAHYYPGTELSPAEKAQ